VAIRAGAVSEAGMTGRPVTTFATAQDLARCTAELLQARRINTSHAQYAAKKWDRWFRPITRLENCAPES
jgi:hypothetical protein